MCLWKRSSVFHSFTAFLEMESVCMVSGCRLDGRAIAIWSQAAANDLSCRLCVQTSSGAHPASYPVDTEGSLPGVKAGGVWRSPLHLVPKSRISRSYNSSHPCRLLGGSGTSRLLLSSLFHHGMKNYPKSCSLEKITFFLLPEELNPLVGRLFKSASLNNRNYLFTAFEEGTTLKNVLHCAFFPLSVRTAVVMRQLLRHSRTAYSLTVSSKALGPSVTFL
jgi:hypothetical protein